VKAVNYAAVNAPRRLGQRVRALRQRAGLSQAALAERLEVSPSYLNLIEHDRRPLTASLLIRLAQVLDLDLKAIATGEDGKLAGDLLEVFADPLFAGVAPAETGLRDLAISEPELARAIVHLHHAYTAAHSSAQTLAAQVLDRHDLPGMERAGLSSEEVTDFLQRHRNHFPELEVEAERVWMDGQLEGEELFFALSRHLERRHGVTVQIATVGQMPSAMRRYDAEKKQLLLSEGLRRGSRNFQLAYQIGLLECSSAMDRWVRDPTLSSEESRLLGRVTLANYFAAAVLMPYAEFLRAAREERYDLDLLQHRFRSNFEQVCHRLCTLQRKGEEGVPFFMVRTDRAGNISKKFSANRVQFPRFGGLCPLRNVHGAFLQPNVLRTQISRLPDGVTFFSVARTIRKHRGGYHAPEILYAIELGCELDQARHLVYSDGIDLGNPAGIVPAGVTCRLCERMDCPARAFPSMHRPLQVDENVRGVSFFAPAGEP
jgi:predicted transcriptional regulator/transcriptional regulator with XRE-family HTH domain